MTEEFKTFDPKDIEKIKEEFIKEDPELPCNMWGYIKELEERILKLEEVRT